MPHPFLQLDQPHLQFGQPISRSPLRLMSPAPFVGLAAMAGDFCITCHWFSAVRFVHVSRRALFELRMKIATENHANYMRLQQVISR